MFDERVLRKTYYQCLLVKEFLFADCPSFNSRQIGLFYVVLLQCPAKAVPGLSADEYRSILKKAPSTVPAREAMLNRKAAPRAVVTRAVAASAGPRGAPPAPDSPPPRVSPPGPGASVPSSDDSSSSSSPSDSASPDGGAGSSSPELDAVLADDGFPRTMLGQPLHHKSQENNGIVQSGLMVRCLNPAHHSRRPCTRYRSIKMDVPRFGAQALVGFLGNWLLRSHERETRAGHRKYRPSAAHMQEFIDTYVVAQDA